MMEINGHDCWVIYLALQEQLRTGENTDGVLTMQGRENVSRLMHLFYELADAVSDREVDFLTGIYRIEKVGEKVVR